MEQEIVQFLEIGLDSREMAGENLPFPEIAGENLPFPEIVPFPEIGGENLREIPKIFTLHFRK